MEVKLTEILIISAAKIPKGRYEGEVDRVNKIGCCQDHQRLFEGRVGRMS